MKTKRQQPAASPGLRFHVNLIFEGKFYRAGEPTCFASISDPALPATFKKYAVSEGNGAPPAEPFEKRLDFELSTLYPVDGEGNRLIARHNREVRRQAVILARQEAERQAIREELNAEPNDTIKSAVESAQASHAADVELQKLQLSIEARRQDQVGEFLEQENQKRLANASPNGQHVSPNITGDDEPQPAPRKLKRRFVKRGVAYRKVKDPRVKLRNSEAVFVRGASGYEKIGEVSISEAGVSLPAAYIGD